MRGWWENENVRLTFFAGLVAFAIYEVSREPGSMPYNQYVRLAYSFLHGKVNILHPEPWLELARYKGKFYSHQGVLPGILLMPFVAIFGETFNIRHFACLLGGGIGAAA